MWLSNLCKVLKQIERENSLTTIHNIIVTKSVKKAQKHQSELLFFRSYDDNPAYVGRDELAHSVGIFFLLRI